MKSSGLLYFVFGVAVGSIVTYYMTKESFEKRAQEDINEMRKEFENSDKTDTENSSEEDEVKDENETSSEETLFRDYDPHKTDYQKFKKVRAIGHDDVAVILDIPPEESEDDEEKEESDPEEAATEHPREGVEELPYIITCNDYTNTMRHFEKVTVEYYDDGALVNENGNMVDADLVGMLNLVMFRNGKTSDPDWMYVRNERIGVDFEVGMKHSNYTDTPAPMDGS